MKGKFRVRILDYVRFKLCFGVRLGRIRIIGIRFRFWDKGQQF